MLSLIYLVSQIVKRYSETEKRFINGAVMLIIKPLSVDGKEDISKYFFEWSPVMIPRLVIKSILDANVIISYIKHIANYFIP